MKTQAPARVVRKISGPYVARGCVHEESGFTWFELLKHDAAPYLHARDVALLARSAQGLDDAVRWPSVPDAVTAMWTHLPTPKLWCDELFDQALGGADADWGVSTACSLGAVLARLHATEVHPGSLPLRLVPAWLQLDRQARSGIAAARKRLPLDACRQLAVDARHELTLHPRCVIHGRFSSGLVVGGDDLRLMGWREAGVGDPRTDLAYMLSELVEAAGLTSSDPVVGGGRLRALLASYAENGGSVHLSGLHRLVADRILQHYAQSLWAFGPRGGIAQVLASVEVAWQELRPLVVAAER